MLIRRLARTQVLRPSSLTCQRCTVAVAAPSWTRQTRSFTSSPPRSNREKVHTLRDLGTPENNARLREEGIPGLYSPEAFQLAYTDYQRLLLDRVNKMVLGTPYQDNTVIAILIMAARDPTTVPMFNNASMLWNNNFYFDNISSATPEPMDKFLETQINASFGSVSAFKATFIATAKAMFGPGFVWLVQESSGTRGLKILTTYLAGSPHPQAHYRRQQIDMNTQAPSEHAEGKAGAFGHSSANAPKPTNVKVNPYAGAASLTPLLCVNTWEHAWLPQFGINGKEAFLHAWYDRVDWKNVNNLVQDRSNENQMLRSLSSQNIVRRRTRY